MSSDMVPLRPHNVGAAFLRDIDSPDGVNKLLHRVNVLHFWEASSQVWKYTVYFLAFVYVLVIFLNAPRTGGLTVCLLPVGLLVGMVAITFVWTGLLTSRMGAPELLASSAAVMRGDTLELRFRQPIRKDTHFPEVKFQLVLREWVRYRCGTKTCTDSHDEIITEEIFPDESVSAGLDLNKRVRFQIPDDAMHTLALSDNKLTWLVIVDLAISNFPDLKETFEIEVLAEVHAA